MSRAADISMCIPEVYFHSLAATQNDHWGVDLSGQYRSIYRKRWDDQELKRLLNDSETVTARVFSRYVRLLKIRAACSTFHPDGAQSVLALENGLFGIVRTTPDGLQELACICIGNIVQNTVSSSYCNVSPAGAICWPRIPVKI